MYIIYRALQHVCATSSRHINVPASINEAISCAVTAKHYSTRSIARQSVSTWPLDVPASSTGRRKIRRREDRTAGPFGDCNRGKRVFRSPANKRWSNEPACARAKHRVPAQCPVKRLNGTHQPRRRFLPAIPLDFEAEIVPGNVMPADCSPLSGHFRPNTAGTLSLLPSLSRFRLDELQGRAKRSVVTVQPGSFSRLVTVISPRVHRRRELPIDVTPFAVKRGLKDRFFQNVPIFFETRRVNLQFQW